MNAGIISNRYAKAILQFATKRGDEERLYHEMRVLSEQFVAFPELRKALEDPTVPATDKIKVLLTAIGENTGETYRRMVELVIGNGRGRYMQSIALMYDRTYRKAKNMLQVKMSTVDPLTAEQEKRLTGIVTDDSGATVEFVPKTVPSLIGGFVLEIEDRRLDASVKSQLNRLRLDLIKD